MGSSAFEPMFFGSGGSMFSMARVFKPAWAGVTKSGLQYAPLPIKKNLGFQEAMPLNHRSLVEVVQYLSWLKYFMVIGYLHEPQRLGFAI
jgi:hypothetical protein